MTKPRAIAVTPWLVKIMGTFWSPQRRPAICINLLASLFPHTPAASEIRLYLHEAEVEGCREIWLQENDNNFGLYHWGRTRFAFSAMYLWLGKLIKANSVLPAILADEKPHKFYLTCETKGATP